MRVLAVCGSLQKASTNLDLLRTAAAIAPSGVEVLPFDGIRHLPLFNPDIPDRQPPESVSTWRAALGACNAVLIASPEYGHSLPGALKNAIDWIIGSGQFYGKPVAITAAASSPERGRRGLDALRTTLHAVDARVVGGNPIVCGPTFNTEVAQLLHELIAVAVR
jgi:NAD(P)H-dependent FMN reductase